jgi:hypothetical protein
LHKRPRKCGAFFISVGDHELPALCPDLSEEEENAVIRAR